MWAQGKKKEVQLGSHCINPVKSWWCFGPRLRPNCCWEMIRFCICFLDLLMDRLWGDRERRGSGMSPRVLVWAFGSMQLPFTEMGGILERHHELDFTHVIFETSMECMCRVIGGYMSLVLFWFCTQFQCVEGQLSPHITKECWGHQQGVL